MGSAAPEEPRHSLKRGGGGGRLRWGHHHRCPSCPAARLQPGSAATRDHADGRTWHRTDTRQAERGGLYPRDPADRGGHRRRRSCHHPRRHGNRGWRPRGPARPSPDRHLPPFPAAPGQAILPGLELPVAVGSVRTVAAEPTLTSVAVPCIIVLIRTFLSFSLELGLTGRWPWRKNTTGPPPESPGPQTQEPPALPALAPAAIRSKVMAFPASTPTWTDQASSTGPTASRSCLIAEGATVAGGCARSAGRRRPGGAKRVK